jgi:hypothetical protein
MANRLKLFAVPCLLFPVFVGAAVPRLLIAVCGLLIAVSGLVFTVSCCAEELLDPTLPPASISAPALDAGSEVVPAAGLQSIIIGKQRRAAIIDGDTVELGARHGEARLIEVAEGYVVLHGPQGRQVLRLFPDVKIISKKVPAEAALGVVRPGHHKHKPLTSREDK